jgi:hypothetical protein
MGVTSSSAGHKCFLRSSVLRKSDEDNGAASERSFSGGSPAARTNANAFCVMRPDVLLLRPRIAANSWWAELKWLASIAQASGPCNLEMPNGASVYDRFFWYLRLLTYNGFVVIIDNHLNSDPTIVNTGVETWFSVRLVTPLNPNPRPLLTRGWERTSPYVQTLLCIHVYTNWLVTGLLQTKLCKTLM